MKKIIMTFLVVLCTSTTAIGGSFFGIEYEGSKIKGTKNTFNNFNLTVGKNYDNGITLGLKFQGEQSIQYKELQDSLEGSIELEKKIVGSLNGYGKFSVGGAFTSYDNYPYYNVESGLRLNLTDIIGVYGAYTYNNVFIQPVRCHLETHKVETGPTFKITNNDAFGLAYTKTMGDDKRDGFKVNYTRSF